MAILNTGAMCTLLTCSPLLRLVIYALFVATAWAHIVNQDNQHFKK